MYILFFLHTLVKETTQPMIDFERIKIFYKFGQTLTLSDVKVLFQAAKTKSYLSGEYLISVNSSFYFPT